MTTVIADGYGPYESPVAPAGRRGRPGELLLALAVAATLAVAGLPVGLLWRAFAPRVEFVMTDQGATTVQPEPEGFVADDGWYVLITLLVGVAAALLVWTLLRRRRGPLLLIGLVVGGVAGGVLAAWVGHQFGYAHYRQLALHAPVGTHFLRPPSVRSAQVGLWFGVLPRVQGSVLIEAVAAATVYLVLAAFHVEPELRAPDPSPYPGHPAAGAAGPVSWEQTEWSAPTAPPVPPEADPAAPPRD